PERVLPEDVEHVRDFVESIRDLLVLHATSRCPAAGFIVSFVLRRWRDLDRHVRVLPRSGGGHAQPRGRRDPGDVLPSGAGGPCREVSGPRPPVLPVCREGMPNPPPR